MMKFAIPNTVRTRESYIPRGAERMLIEGLDPRDIQVYYYTTNTGKPAGIGFRGESDNPAWSYEFPNLDAREGYTADWLKNVRAHLRLIESRQEPRAASVATLRIGDVLYYTFGGGTTHVEFYLVTDTDHVTLTLREIGQEVVEQDHRSGIVIPKEPFEYVGLSFTKTNLSMRYGRLARWNGQGVRYTSNVGG